VFKLGLETYYWTAVNQFFLWGSLSVYFAVTFTMYSNGMYLIFTSFVPFIGECPSLLNSSAYPAVCVRFKQLQMNQSFSGTARNSLNQPNVWLTIFLTTILCSLPVVAKRFLFIQLKPTINDKVGDSTSSFSNTIYHCCTHSCMCETIFMDF